MGAGRAEGPQEKPGQLRRGGAAAGRAAADHWPAEVSTGELWNDAGSFVLLLVTSPRLVTCYITMYQDHAVFNTEWLVRPMPNRFSSFEIGRF